MARRAPDQPVADAEGGAFGLHVSGVSSGGIEDECSVFGLSTWEVPPGEAHIRAERRKESGVLF